jgi:hypothetical protein
VTPPRALVITEARAIVIRELLAFWKREGLPSVPDGWRRFLCREAIEAVGDSLKRERIVAEALVRQRRGRPR